MADSNFYALDTDEVECAYRICDSEQFRKIIRHKSLLSRFKNRLLQQYGDQSVIFEIFLTHYFHPHLEIEHAFKTDVGGDDVDFKCKDGNITWLIEAVSIAESQAQRASTIQHAGDASSCSTNAVEDVVLAQRKICEKVFHDGNPKKFPFPAENVFHVIIVDTKGDLIGYRAGDVQFVAKGDPKFIGLFDSRPHPALKGASCLRDRVHAIIFSTGGTSYRMKGMFSKASIVTNEELLKKHGIGSLPPFPIRLAY